MNRLILTGVITLTLVACGDKAADTSQALTPAAPSAADTAVMGPMAQMEADLHQHTAVLASDEFEGRAPATRGEELTIAYLAEQFEAVGLQPGNGDSWYQDVPITTTTPIPTGLEIRGANFEAALAYAKDFTARTTQQVERVELVDSPLVFAGYGINAPERGWNDYEGIDVTGKTVVVLVNDPGFATQDPELFNGNTMTYYGRWTYKYEEAARQGAAALLIVHETDPAGYPWAVVELGFTGHTLGITADDNNMGAVGIEGWISDEVAADLMAQVGLDFQELKSAAEKPGFQAVPLGDLTASIDLRLAKGESLSRNVVGVLPGTQYPDESVVYSSHWDHFGKLPGKDGAPDQVFNGAVDNASGTAALVGLARQHVASGPYDRSLVFLAVTAEEFGLLGSMYYAQNPLYPNATTVANLNMDGVYSFDGRTKDVAIVGFGNSELDNYLRVQADAQDRVVVSEPNPEKGYYYRSDHFSFAKEGVPALYLTTATDSRERGRAWGQAQLDAYVANDYHKVTDDYSPDWDMSGAAEDAMLFFGIAEALANSRDWPNWSEGTEFKAKRDETSAARAE